MAKATTRDKTTKANVDLFDLIDLWRLSYKLRGHLAKDKARITHKANKNLRFPQSFLI